MKIVIASDVHGNLEALQCLSKQADFFLLAGDIVDYGPDSLACLEFVQQNRWLSVRGNHDQAMGYQVDCGCSQQMLDLSIATRKLARKTLATNHLTYLQKLPLDRYLFLEGARFYITHAVPGDLYRYMSSDIAEEELALLLKDIDAEFIIWGHTHIPYIRKTANKVIINPGSVGQPRNGVPQASWAEWNDGEIKLCSSPYPHQLTINKIYRSPLNTRHKQQLEQLLTTGKIPSTC